MPEGHPLFKKKDECGVCNGPGIVMPWCDCEFNTWGCDGECGGGNYVDECGVCNG